MLLCKGGPGSESEYARGEVAGAKPASGRWRDGKAKEIDQITQVCLDLIHWVFFQRQENGLAAEDWCEGADDWGSDNEEMSSPQLTLDFGNDSNSAKDLDCTAQLQDLCLQEAVLAAALTVPPGEETALPSVVPQFLPYYICVVDEDDYRDVVSLDHAHNLLREYQQREGIDMEQLISQRWERVLLLSKVTWSGSCHSRYTSIFTLVPGETLSGRTCVYRTFLLHSSWRRKKDKQGDFITHPWVSLNILCPVYKYPQENEQKEVRDAKYLRNKMSTISLICFLFLNL